jgi:hypothetical protein
LRTGAPRTDRVMRACRTTRTLARMDEPVRLIEPPHVAGILLIPTVPRLRQAHTGWTVFAGLVLLLMAAWNLVWGFFEILNDYYFTGDTVMAGSHSLWGWLYITVGACQLLLVGLVFSRNPTGVFLAIVVVALNAVSHLLGFGHRVAWSIVALALDGLVLFALLNYGFRVQETRRRQRPA